MDILEPIVINDPEGAKKVVKTLYANDVKWVRADQPPSDLEQEEIQAIKMAIAEHPEWNDYEVASWVLDQEE
ncbi:MAG: hypothetical protein K6E27_08875 [Eubacterium sp.]|nr:hypothetical protein [Eubacterium sp.]